jgi:hypothetical protein
MRAPGFFLMEESCPVDIRATDSLAPELFGETRKLTVKKNCAASHPGVLH